MPVTGADIVTVFHGYLGTPYVTGGGSPKGWDCSGAVNYVLGARLGLTLPGGIKGFSGKSHGPVVFQYAAWSAGSVKVKRPAPGDLVIWNGIGNSGHIGVVIGPNRMISALNHAEGTVETAIAGFGPAGRNPSSYRRLKSAEAAAGGLTWNATTTAAQTGGLAQGCLLYLAALVMVLLAILAALAGP